MQDEIKKLKENLQKVEELTRKLSFVLKEATFPIRR